MQPEALYVVSEFGRDRFIWATSAAEARQKAAAARTSASRGTPCQYTVAVSSPRTTFGERRARYESASER